MGGRCVWTTSTRPSSSKRFKKRLRLRTAAAFPEKGNSGILFQLARIFSTDIKDHELEDCTKALVPQSAGRGLAPQLSDAGSSVDWAKDQRQGNCASSSEEDVATNKNKTPKTTHMIKNKSEKSSAVRKGPQTSYLTTPTIGFVCHADNKNNNQLGQRCLSIQCS